ncbi:MAG: hypothetical protein HND58_08785 [Planctomycetota bacterium]|nr:MAG: hypothetical protein HND58_08785 [Planctomycetota bacterium]
MSGVLSVLAQRGRGGAGVGSEIAEWADSPERVVLVWVIGGAILIGVIALLVKMKMDKD